MLKIKKSKRQTLPLCNFPFLLSKIIRVNLPRKIKDYSYYHQSEILERKV